jgi:capsular polysaccharide export protein
MEARVGGTFWAARPSVPEAPYTVVRAVDRKACLGLIPTLPTDRPVLCWVETPSDGPAASDPMVDFVSGCCDPWHIVSGASEVIAAHDDEIVPIAILAGVPVRAIGGQGATNALDPDRRRIVRDGLVAPFDYCSPFTGEPIDLSDAIELCAFWRGLIDSNRPVSAALGFAFWKRETVGPLLWGGSSATFPPLPGEGEKAARIFAWKSRVPPATLAQFEQSGATLIEVEDGFIRSIGLGADCVPPLSIVVDPVGSYFDPSAPSELVGLLQHGDFPPASLDRAKRLRHTIVERAISKYGERPDIVERRVPDRAHLLVAGQVEDDRSVQCGGGAVTTNLELLRRVRADAPQAYILYKPHPDVEAGHRVGRVPDDQAARYADEVVRDQPITSLIDMVDEVHVNTSLAGFEALLRNKPVTTHGVPFYAGWGLTRDLGAVPDRRTARRTLDELVAAALLVYPRYLDPVTGLPCPPEILVRRLGEGTSGPSGGPLVSLRRLQGFLKRRFMLLRA